MAPNLANPSIAQGNGMVMTCSNRSAALMSIGPVANLAPFEQADMHCTDGGGFAAPSAIAIVALCMSFRHINHSAHPFIAPRLIHGLGFGPVKLVNALYTVVTFGMMALVPPYAWLAGSAFLVGAGPGIVNPASRNAGRQLAPDQASTLAALRSMCLQLGSMITISIAMAILASSDQPDSIQAWVYVAAGLLLVAASPLIAGYQSTAVRGNGPVAMRQVAWRSVTRMEFDGFAAATDEPAQQTEWQLVRAIPEQSIRSPG